MSKFKFGSLLLLWSMALTTVGYANTNVKENACSDGVVLVDDVTIDILNQVTFDTVFDLERIDNYTLVSVGPLSDSKIKDLQSMVTIPNKIRQEVTRGVLSIQLKEAKRKRILLSTCPSQKRGASTQLVFYNTNPKRDVT